MQRIKMNNSPKSSDIRPIKSPMYSVSKISNGCLFIIRDDTEGNKSFDEVKELVRGLRESKTLIGRD